MKQPRGFEKGKDDYVQKLLKTFYSIIQDVYDWTENLNQIFEGYSYYKSHADPHIRSKLVIMMNISLFFIQTDNIFEALSTLKSKSLAKPQLGFSYEIKDLERAELILRMQINKNFSNGNIILS